MMYDEIFISMHSIELVEEWNVLVTSSMDSAVRLWTLEGQYIGMVRSVPSLLLCHADCLPVSSNFC